MPIREVTKEVIVLVLKTVSLPTDNNINIWICRLRHNIYLILQQLQIEKKNIKKSSVFLSGTTTKSFFCGFPKYKCCHFVKTRSLVHKL